MKAKHTSRSGMKYFLHKGKTKKGNAKYFFSSKTDGHIVEAIPNGYEIYENPNAQVFLRKVQTKIIQDEEVCQIDKELSKHKNPNHYKTDVKKNTIVIHEINQDYEAISQLFPFADKSKVENLIISKSTYSPIMRFILGDKEKRLFTTERFCFKGSIDDWIYIGGSGPLQKLSKRFIKHLGKESFYEL